MKITVTQTLKNMDGQVMKDNDGQGNAVDATLRMAIVNAVLSPVQKESGMEKVKKYELAKRIHQSDEVDLTAEEISLIKERVGEVYPALITGQIWDILEGK
jgi:hypothetical protein